MGFEEVIAKALGGILSETGQVVAILIICGYVAYKTGSKLLERCERREEVATDKWEKSSLQVAEIQLETARQLSDVSRNLQEIRADIKEHLRK